MTTPTPLRFADFVAWLRAKPKTWRDKYWGHSRCATCPIALFLRKMTGLPWQVGSRECWVSGHDGHELPLPFRKFVEQSDEPPWFRSRDALLAIAERIQAEEAA